MTPTVRLATIGDARAIATIHVETWRAAYAGIVPDDYLSSLSIDEREQRWFGILGAPRSTTLVVEREGRVIGWCSYGRSRDAGSPKNTGELWAIYVDHRHFRSGAGRALWAEARRALQADGFDEAMVWVLRDNAPAIRFYEREGFVPEPEAEKTETVAGVALPHLRLRCRLVPVPGLINNT